MCGIAGIWSAVRSSEAIRADLQAAVQSLHHRGPDDRGTWMNDAGLGLGHTRLSILDLSSLGHQPMVSADGQQVIVFNGEIYNFAEIRRRLEGLGHRFAGSGDTEVVLHAFREWGTDAVQQFIGMFAIALWDTRSQTLQLFRDRVGVKPLYYGWDGQTLWFGSELKALRAFRHWKPTIDRQSLGEYLQYAYISGDRSIYERVHKLRPGHFLTFRPGGSPVVQPYWSVLSAVGNPLPGSDSEIEEQLEELLVSAFRYRMVSDVPVGVYLSGGIDSSLVTALLARHHPQTIHTFTIGSPLDSHDESRWARRVAEHCGTQHTEYILGPSDALELVRNWGTLFDEPFGDSSGIPTLLVSRLAREQVKVVLSADGGDELFSGYGWYPFALQRLASLERIPGPVRGAFAAMLSVLPDAPFSAGTLAAALPSRGRAALVKGLTLRRILAAPTVAALVDTYGSIWHPDELPHLIGTYRPPAWGRDEYPGTRVDQMSLRDFHHYLPDDILVKVDRTTMAVSIEGREPLLDHRLAEFAFRLPVHLRQGTLGSKHILRSILYRYVPRELLDRPKQGFAIPLEKWLRHELRGLLEQYLAPDRIRSGGLMDEPTVRRLLRDFQKGDDRLTYRLQLLLFFEMWREQWM